MQRLPRLAWTPLEFARAPKRPTKNTPPPAPGGQGESLFKDLPVLVVEDDPASAQLLTNVLAAKGCNIRTARNAEDATKILALFRPRVIVLELVLPFMSGLLFAQRVKANPATQDIVIIAVTAFNGPDTERVTRSAGCAAYVRKPIDPLTFPRTILELLEGQS